MKFSLHKSKLFDHNGRLYHERYNRIPVHTDGSKHKCLMYMKNVPKPTLGEVWHFNYCVYATNDDLRDRGYSCYITTELRLSDETSHDRIGMKLLSAPGGANATPQGHHKAVRVNKYIEWDIPMLAKVPENPVIKLMVWSASDRARSGDDLKIELGKGFLELMRFYA